MLVSVCSFVVVCGGVLWCVIVVLVDESVCVCV